MAMSPMLKWQKSIERAKIARSKQKLRRQDIQDLKDRDMWNDPRTRYLDEFGYILPDAPQWWLNLRRAWNTNDQSNTVKKVAMALKSDKLPQILQPKKRYKKVEHKPKLKHSEKMKLLLADHGILIDQNNMLCDEFSEWKFCVNGRLQRNDEPTISVFYFLQHYADT